MCYVVFAYSGLNMNISSVLLMRWNV